MNRHLTLVFLIPLIASVAACGSSDTESSATENSDTESSATENSATESSASTGSSLATTSTSPTPSVDVEYYEQNLPTVAGNVVTTIRSAKRQGIENTPPGDTYDPGSYYTQMTTECQSKITRSMFRQDFIDRVFPLVDEGPTERVTATITGTEGVAKIEQISGTTLVMAFDVSSTSEEHLCNADGTIAISAE